MQVGEVVLLVHLIGADFGIGSGKSKVSATVRCAMLFRNAFMRSSRLDETVCKPTVTFNREDRMNAFLNGVARAVAETFDLPEPILEIGSYQVEKQRDLANLRGLFPDNLYQGIDIRPGPGVDLVGNVEELPHLDGSVGTVLALSTFEHVRRILAWLRGDSSRVAASRRTAGVDAISLPDSPLSQ